MAEEHRGKALLTAYYDKTRRRKMIKGLLFFVLSSLLVILVSLAWQGGIDWLFVAILSATGLYGFFSLMVSSRMAAFDTSPIGLFLSGKSKKYDLEVLLIRRSNMGAAQDGEKYKAVISFIEKSGARISIMISEYSACQQVIGYLKERLSGSCTIMDMTFDEFKANRREHLHEK